MIDQLLTLTVPLMLQPLVICQLKLMLSLKVNFVTYQKNWNTKPINCVGV